jgi:hypothetical protein
MQALRPFETPAMFRPTTLRQSKEQRWKYIALGATKADYGCLVTRSRIRGATEWMAVL